VGSVSWVETAVLAATDVLAAAVTSVGLLFTGEDPVGTEVRLGLSLA
jgi:hypothetical protein